MQGLIEEKKKLRLLYKQARLNVLPELKEEADRNIFRLAAGLGREIAPAQVLCYVSSPPLEADTRQLLTFLFESRMDVAVPKCVGGGNDMIFYRISSFADLKKGCFGIDEPDPLICSPVEPVSDSLCFVPGLAFDEQNYRIGFGKGYYDKFLGNYRGITAGICPEYCMAESLPHEEHDRAVDYVITDRKIRKRMISDD